MLRVIESSPLRPFLLSGYVTPLVGKSGVVVVDVPRYSEHTIVLTTPFVTLPLLLQGDPDASTVVSAMNFIRERMGELNDIIHQ